MKTDLLNKEIKWKIPLLCLICNVCYNFLSYISLFTGNYMIILFMFFIPPIIIAIYGIIKSGSVTTTCFIYFIITFLTFLLSYLIAIIPSIINVFKNPETYKKQFYIFTEMQLSELFLMFLFLAIISTIMCFIVALITKGIVFYKKRIKRTRVDDY